jgi:hypothetical protein
VSITIFSPLAFFACRVRTVVFVFIGFYFSFAGHARAAL